MVVRSGIPRPAGLRGPVYICVVLLVLEAQLGDCFLTNYRGISSDGFSICPSDMRNCSCKSYTGSESEIDCPEADPTIQLRIEPRQYAELKCQRNRRYEFDQIPQLSIGATKRLTIDDCPFPRHQSILQFVSFLGTAQVKLLWLKNNANHEQSASLVRHHFEGLESLDRLAISNAKLADIRADLFEHLPNLTWLDMRDNIFQLPPTIFDTLPRLRILELSFNSMEVLDPRLLRNLPNLRLLTLWHNKLHSISREAFEGVPLLERLDISANQLEALPSDLFAPLTKLSELALGFNHFRTLPQGLFRSNKELRKLKLAYQRVELETLPGDLLQELPAMDQVILERNGLTKLPGTLLYGSANVTELNLAGNRLRELPEDLLRDQLNLRELKLQNNQLVSLPDGLLRNTGELRSLHLSHNQLERLSGSMLRALNKLEELYLDHNQLQTIDQRAFQSTGALHTLHLQSNQLSFETFSALPKLETTIDAAAAAIEAAASAGTSDEFGIFVQDGTPFQYMHALRELDLSNNFLTSVPRDLLVNTHELQRLNLTRNNITSLTYSSLQFLAPDITVDLRHNSIFEIDLADMERLARLETSDPSRGDEAGRSTKARILLNDNPLNCNCIVYTFARYMQRRLNSSSLYERVELVADTLACEGPEHLHGMLIRDVPTRELLCELDSPTTAIRHCPDGCSCLIRPADSGVIVNCNSQGLNQVPSLPRPTSFGYRFIELHVENNNISSLPSTGAAAGGWNDVHELYASNNSIDKLRLEQLPAGLRVLDLTRNKLTGLDGTVTEALTNRADKLLALRLAHNEWTCQCEASQFLTFAHANARSIDDFTRLQCADGRQLDQTTLGDLCTDRTGSIVLACILISIVACLLALLSFVYYTYHLELKVWLFKHGICLWLVAEEELDRDKLYDAFVSYSHKDEAFITEHLVPTLERPPMNFRICWHVRDWTPGEMISSQISSSVEQSRRTIIVLSSNFLESLWGQLEFRTAHLQSMAERRNRLIIVIYGDIGNIDDLEPELRAYLHTNTYVRWGDPWFWDKVRFAMPHPPKVRGGGANGGGSGANVVKSGVSTAGGLFMKQLQPSGHSTVDDKLELIKPQSAMVPATPPALTTPPTEPNGSIPATPNGSVGPFIISNGLSNGTPTHRIASPPYRPINGGHINGAFMINTNAKQSDV
ncbi:AGAP001004-PA-like protein [Anopheles sinensis]|uniref:AGAP001004-PA-like protein n=1 Tax=Anopheles sinensis TaxID=74873 RepID=A0A084WPQ0_ANOSI|nr:AGAP001004-PA-like protein [Anopheles sinensis]